MQALFLFFFNYSHTNTCSFVLFYSLFFTKYTPIKNPSDSTNIKVEKQRHSPQFSVQQFHCFKS